MNTAFLSKPFINRFRGGTHMMLAVLLAICFLAVAPTSRAEESPAPHWQPPVARPYTIVKVFDKPAKKWQAGHRGVDFAVSPHAEIFAPSPGVISFSGTVVDRQVITITHDDGHKSSFEPVVDGLKVGEHVETGQHIANVAPDIEHCDGGGHCLHWGIRTGQGKAEEYLNPELFLGDLSPSILLPIGEDFAA